MTAPEMERRAFPDTVVGKIVIGVAIAAASAVITVAVGQLTASKPDPVLAIEPPDASVEAGRTVEFAATGLPPAKDPRMKLDWQLSGAPLANNPIGSCESEDGARIIRCRLALPGIFALTLRSSTAGGREIAAVASVEVVAPGAYIALVLAGVYNAEAAYRALLNSVDWVEIQRSTPRPIVLYDPDLGAPIFAASHRPREGIDVDVGSLAGVTVSVWSEAHASADALRAPLEELGARVRLVAFGSRPEDVVEPAVLYVGSLQEFDAIVGAAISFTD